MIQESEEISADNESNILRLVVSRYNRSPHGTMSTSTVPSTLAAEWIRQNESIIARNNALIDDSQAVDLGDWINNFYASEPNRDSSSVSSNILVFRGKRNTKWKHWIAGAVIIIATLIGLGVLMLNLKPESPNNLGYFTREEWMRAEHRSLELPIRRIIIAHTTGDSCYSFQTCLTRMKEIQRLNAHLNDIPYNFLIGGDGSIFEGRGIDFEGEHTANKDGSSFNDIGICIAFIGNFEKESPTDNQIEGFHNLTKNFISKGLLVHGYKIFFQDQLAKSSSPANALLEVVEKFEEFYSVTKIYRRDEWNASDAIWESVMFNPSVPISRWVAGHEYDSQFCSSLESCFAALDKLQQSSFNRNSGDIGYNFLIGSDDGFIFEGRGFGRVGTHTEMYNSDSHGVGFIGNFTSKSPTRQMISALENLIKDSVALGKVDEDYIISTNLAFQESGNQGNALLEEIKQLDKYSNREV